jgi:hypothetical protein
MCKIRKTPEHDPAFLDAKKAAKTIRRAPADYGCDGQKTA